MIIDELIGELEIINEGKILRDEDICNNIEDIMEEEFFRIIDVIKVFDYEDKETEHLLMESKEDIVREYLLYTLCGKDLDKYIKMRMEIFGNGEEIFIYVDEKDKSLFKVELGIGRYIKKEEGF